ncbi:MAG: hypothetical protein GTN40_04235 [Candidatus Aenigmarchaeota archaeon]|nr:hypothetical protein [Candidatus Aenigmarchaeota archaeon]
MRKIERRYQYQKSNKNTFITILLIGLLLGIWIGYYISYEPSQQVETKVITEYIERPLNDSYSSAQINLAAVDQDGNGVVTPLIVEIKPGNGKILTNIEKLLFWIDTQQSIQVAKQVAEDVTKLDVDKYDLIYTVKSEATLVGGPSAGASLTVATIAALQKKEIKSDIMMTGTINPDGTIGEVGGILEKAKIAKELGAKVFLVPEGQGTQTYLKPEENCVRRGGFIFCTTKYKEITVNIGKDVGISVIEIEDINDALKYFIF